MGAFNKLHSDEDNTPLQNEWFHIKIFNTPLYI